MIKFLSKRSTFIFSVILTTLMFIIVVFIVSPLIDGGNGLGVVKLQLSFDKFIGVGIVESWGKSGITFFNQWIFTDYIYAFAYALNFASILANILVKKGLHQTKIKYLVLMPFVAGLLDMTENTLELFFINNQVGFSESLFYFHSVIATVKFAIIALSLMAIIVLLLKRKS